MRQSFDSDCLPYVSAIPPGHDIGHEVAATVRVFYTVLELREVHGLALHFGHDMVAEG